MKPSRLVALAFSIFALSLAGQGMAVAQAGQSGEARKGRPKERALALLSRAIEEAQILRLAENRVLVMGEAADLMWPSDERRARDLFKAAASSLSEILVDGEKGLREDGGLETYVELRQRLLEILLRRDAQAALEFATKTRLPSQVDDEFQFDLTLATQLAVAAPEKAGQAAERSLAKGLSYRLGAIVARIRERDENAATKLVGSILTRLQSENLATNHEAALVASSILQMAGGAGAGSPGTATRPLPLVTGRQSFRDLMEKFAAAALKTSSSDPALLLSLQEVDVERYAPALAPRVRGKIEELTKLSNSGGDGGRMMGVEDVEEPVACCRSAPDERHIEELTRQAAVEAEQGEKKLALGLLREASALLGGARARNPAQLYAKLHVARTYAALNDHAQSFSIMESVIDQLNELADAAEVADGFINEEPFFRDEEMMLRLVGKFPDDNVQALIAALSEADFSSTETTAKRLRRVELRIFVYLLIARGVLDSSEK